VLGILAVLVIYTVFERDRVKEAITIFLVWVEANPSWGVFAFILLYAFATG